MNTPPTLPTEPIGSIPRPLALVQAIRNADAGQLDPTVLETLYDEAVRDTLRRCETTGSPVVCDGEQRKNHNFADYAVHGLPNFAPDGFKLRFTHHTRQWPRLTAGPFRYRQRGDQFLAQAQRRTTLPLKQAVISPSALSLFYPAVALPEYPARVLHRRSAGLACSRSTPGAFSLNWRTSPTGRACCR